MSCFGSNITLKIIGHNSPFTIKSAHLSHSTRNLLLPFLIVLSLLAGSQTRAQTIAVHGTVYNMYRTRPLDGVSVIKVSGGGTTTDSNGNYMVVATLQDSIYFSYLGRATVKYAVNQINYAAGFDIALHVDATELKEVKVMPRNYHYDSLQNREDYAKYFNFKKPGFKINPSSSGDGLGVGVDLDELINIFRFQRTHRLQAFQRRLEDEEQDKYVDHRFNRSIVLKVTKLQGDELDSFMTKYRPSYEFCKRATDYDLFDYIKLAFREYQKDKKERP